MRFKMLVLTLGLLAALPAAAVLPAVREREATSTPVPLFSCEGLPGQTARSPIAGVWEGKAEGLPVITITIKEDGSKLSGSVTFYRIEDDGNGPTVTGKETTELINPKFDGKVFSYQVKGRNDEMVNHEMEIAGNDEGLIKMRRVINSDTEYVPVKMTRLREKREAAAPLQPAPTVTGPDKSATPDALRAIEALIDDQVRKDEFSGVALVADNGKPIFQKAAGLASKEFSVPNTLETRFNLGSINKVFTQILIGQLAAEQKLSLDDHLNKYLPDYANREAAEKVSVRQLLNMTSGIGDFIGPEFEASPKNKIRELRDYLPLFAGKPLLFTPGSKNQYSNGGYVVLGLIIEKVTGRTYYDCARERIFEPAGMNDTGYFDADIPVANVANGYTRQSPDGTSEDHWRNNIYTRPARGSSAGGGYSTAADLLRFANALHSGKLVIPNYGGGSPGANIPRDSHGLGIAGGAPGINSTLETGVAGRYTVIVMSNYDPPSAINLARQIRRLLGQPD